MVRWEHDAGSKQLINDDEHRLQASHRLTRQVTGLPPVREPHGADRADAGSWSDVLIRYDTV